MDIFQITIEVLILLLGLHLVFFKSYFGEKGKNIATKEDIEDITKLVENVKNRIHYTTQSKLSFQIEERNALINFYEKYYYWLNYMLEITFLGVNKEDIVYLSKIENTIYEANFEFIMSEGRKNLFVINNDLDESIKELKKKTMELQKIVLLYIVKFESWINNVNLMLLTTSFELQNDEYDNHLKLKLDIMQNFYNEREEKLKEITLINRKFSTLCSTHLQNILKDE